MEEDVKKLSRKELLQTIQILEKKCTELQLTIDFLIPLTVDYEWEMGTIGEYGKLAFGTKREITEEERRIQERQVAERKRK
jgi:hypothetical protein